MSEETNNQDESNVIKAIREEYEKKLEEQKVKAEEEKKIALDEAEKKHIEQIRALLTGQPDKTDKQKEPESFEEELLERLRKKHNK